MSAFRHRGGGGGAVGVGFLRSGPPERAGLVWWIRGRRIVPPWYAASQRAGAAPQVMFAEVPVMPLARSLARNAAVAPTSASVVHRPSMVRPPIHAISSSLDIGAPVPYSGKGPG